MINKFRPIQITKPLGIRPRRFTEYRVRGLITPTKGIKKGEAACYHAFDVLRAALTWQAETHGLTLENAIKVPALALKPEYLLDLVHPIPGLPRCDAYLITRNADPIAVVGSGNARVMRELQKLPEANKNAKIFSLFENVGLFIADDALADFDPALDRLAFWNLSAFCRRVVELVGIDPVEDIYAPLTYPPAFWASLSKIQGEARNTCFELLKGIQGRTVPLAAVSEWMESKGLDVKLIKKVFSK